MTSHTARRATSPEDLAQLHALRHDVFVVEQGVPADLERDELDAGADHVLVADGRGAVATGRLVRVDADTGKIGRMAVRADARGAGAGKAVLAELERIAGERGVASVILHAQASVVGFYARQGYAAEGPRFEEAGIEHVLMRKRLGTP
jgi:predicted GNAT family N-acyltransferase